MSEKILVIRVGSLGDIVLTSATIINLKINHPDCQIIYLCKERFRPIVEMIDGVDEIIALPDGISASAYFALLLELDKRNFDTIIDLQGNFRSWLARKTITANHKSVYPKRRYERILAVKRKTIPASWPHTIDLYNEALRQLDLRAPAKRPVLTPPSLQSGTAVETFLEKNKRFVVVAPGAAHLTKQYPADRFVEIANGIHQRTGAGIVWATTSSETVTASPLGEIGAENCLELVDHPIESLAGLLSRAVLTVANDSGITHISSAVGTPVVALFGPTHPVLGFAPRGMFDRVVEVEEQCRPCSLHGKKKCYRDQRYCFDRIRPEDVVTSALDLMGKTEPSCCALFIDRDGTTIVDKDYLSDPERVELIDGSVQALQKAMALGYKIVIISNQSGVARGYFDIESVDRVNARLLEMLAAHQIEVDGVYFCPHYPGGTVERFARRCDCRKPATGMVEEAAYQLGVSLRKSYVIGDKLDDIHLAKASGATPILVRTGYGTRSESGLGSNRFYEKVITVDNLLGAVEYLEERDKNVKSG